MKKKRFQFWSKSKHHQKTEPEHPGDGSQGRAGIHTGSTTQGGSNFGQGSHFLDNDAHKQGADKGSGANYDNEAGKLSELPDE